MSSTKRREGASNSHILTVVEKLLIIHSINGNAAKCLRFYGPLPVWCALNRNRHSEEQGELRWPNELLKTAKSLPNENNGWLFLTGSPRRKNFRPRRRLEYEKSKG